MTKVVRDNARIMSLDKANSKLLVEVKKLHCPEDNPSQFNPSMPATVAELDLVNGGDDAPSSGTTGQEAGDVEEPAGDGAEYDLC